MRITTTRSSNFYRLFDLLDYQIERYPNNFAVNEWSTDNWKPNTIHQLKARVDNLSIWLLNQGLRKGDKLILVPFIGNIDWLALDLASLQIGIIVVPIHPSLHKNEVGIILKETKARYCITANQGLSDVLSKIAENIEFKLNIKPLVQGEKNTFSMDQVEAASKEELQNLNRLKSEINEGTIATIMYTSGSSGEPKGVMLSHGNIIHNIKALLTIIPLRPGQKVLSFLPFSHILERMTCYAYLAFGVSIYFSETHNSFVRDFKSVRPYFCTAVPRVLEKMYDYLLEQSLSKIWLKRKLFSWAIQIGSEYRNGNSKHPLYRIKVILARLTVLNYWRGFLGGKIQYMAVGAAALRPEIGKLFTTAGIKVIEGYGMTEAAPLISINRFDPGLNKLGTVGLAIPGVQIKIDEASEDKEGEILIKGPNVMAGYFNKESLNAEVFTSDGWFRTGDIGKFVDHHFLKITDRKKEIFKTSSGKYIAPLPLQNLLCQSPFIQRCLIIGFQRSFVTALIVPNFTFLESWCLQEQIHWTSAQFMVHNIKVRAKLQSEIDLFNETLPAYKKVRNFTLCHNEWTVEAGEITNTLKPIRYVLEAHYQSEIEKMYS